MDICRKCSVELIEGENWYVSFAQAKFTNRICKPCANAANAPNVRRYVRANPDRIKESARSTYKRNREKYMAARRRDYLRNRDARKAYSRAYYAKHAERINAAARARLAKKRAEQRED